MSHKSTHAGLNDPIQPKECLSKIGCLLQDCAQRGDVKGLVVQDLYRTDTFEFSYRRLIYAVDARVKGTKWLVRFCPGCGLDLTGYSTPAEKLTQPEVTDAK